MADIGKVIDGLNETISYLRLKTGGVVDRCIQHQYDALELLKEQEPVSPKKWIPKGQILARVRGYYCPVCDTGISQGDRFCHRCGRGLKWDA